MKLKIITIAHHRNGVAGAPFDIILFRDAGPERSRKVAILFDQQAHCAVLDVARLAAGDIAFASNSWRGDNYEPSLRTVIELHHKSLPASDSLPRKQGARPTSPGPIIANYGTGDDRENLVDLLTDMMHWCESFGEPFEKFHATARMHFAEEAKAFKKGV